MGFKEIYNNPYGNNRHQRYGRGEVTCPDCGEEFRRAIDVRSHKCPRRGRGSRFSGGRS